MEAAKFELGQEDLTGGNLADVDKRLAKLPDGYGETRIVLMPRDPQWAYTYWDIPNEHKEELRRLGGQQLALRIYDVTDINLDYQSPHSIQEYPVDELAQEWYLPFPVSDRDYAIDVGYRCVDGRWLVLARSAPVHVPPVYPSDWIEEQFITVNFDEDLRGKTLYQLVPPAQPMTSGDIYDKIYDMAQNTEAQRVAGSLFGSMQHVPGSMVPQQAVSSYVFPSGIGMWSGVGMSGVGFSASMPLLRPRKFWLIADAELIVYGATEPDAKVTIGGRPVQLNADGTFRFQMSFQDGLIDPIMAVAADGEQMRSIHMKFTRETPTWDTNTKEEADEFEQLILLGSILTFEEWLLRFKAENVPKNFPDKVIKQFKDLKENFSVEVPTKRVGFRRRKLILTGKLKFKNDLEEKLREAAELAKEVLELQEIQMALYGKLTEVWQQIAYDPSGVGEAIKYHPRRVVEAITHASLKAIEERSKLQSHEKKITLNEEVAKTIALIMKILLTQEGQKILELGKQSREEVFKRISSKEKLYSNDLTPGDRTYIIGNDNPLSS